MNPVDKIGVEEHEYTFENYKPSILSWITALSCTALILYGISISDQHITGVYHARIRDRLIYVLDTNIRPDAILDDEFIKKKPEKILMKIQKSIDLFNTIYSDNYERAKIIVEESRERESTTSKELRKAISVLFEVQKDLKMPNNMDKVSPLETQKIFKEKALELSRNLIRDQSIPNVGAFSEMTYKKLNNLVNE